MALLLGLAMLPAGAIAMQVSLNSVDAREAAYEEALGRRALQSISVERGAIDEVREMLRVLSTTPALQQIEAGDCRTWLGEVAERYPYVAALSISEDEGRVLCSVPHAPTDFRAPMTPLRQRAIARDAFTIGYVEHGALTGQPVLGAFEPIRAEGRRVGFVGASISLNHLRSVLDRSHSLTGARSAIMDSEGRVLVQSAPRGDQASVGLPSADQVRDHLGPDPMFVDVENGSAVIVPIYAPDLYAVMAWPPERPNWQRWIALALTLVAPLIIWALAVAAGWFAIEVFVARPLSSLEGAARGYARGEDIADPPALRSAPEEIRSLRRTLAAMAKTLRGREQRLVEALAEERALLREVHHRVKNNLQMVASLLNIQARSARDDSEAWGLARAHDRVQLLALVHQKIYSSGEVRELRVDELAAEIARQLLQSRGAAVKDINLIMQVDEARADVDRAVPLTFLIGEGVSMALDALSDAGPVELRLFVHQDEDGSTRFAIDSDIDTERAGAPGPGARLIDAFARQLGADIGRDPERPFMHWVRVPPLPAST
ncbi:MAG TPA: histidine kinase dimerization/phosphoacceptor domain -containing protein [Verrucomicrobiae bacterium]|nr:histidine kinase dimerization/phosphoacceptor domain -containing protein [Verrucomicrobiae bacterium]